MKYLLSLLIILCAFSFSNSNDSKPSVDTSWLSNNRFVVRTIKLDTIRDTFDYVIIKLQHPIDWELMLEDVQKTIDKKGK